MFLTAAATAALLRAFSCCAVSACALCVTTPSTITAVSGSTLAVDSPATVTLVVRFDFLAQPTANTNINPTANNNTILADVFICVYPPVMEMACHLDIGSFKLVPKKRTSRVNQACATRLEICG